MCNTSRMIHVFKLCINSKWVEVIVVEVAERRYFFIRGLPLIKQYLNLSLELGFLRELSDASGCLRVLFTVKTASIST